MHPFLLPLWFDPSNPLLFSFFISHFYARLNFAILDLTLLRLHHAVLFFLVAQKIASI